MGKQKIIFRLFTLCLSVIMLFSVNTIALGQSIDYESKEMDSLDIMLIAYRFMSGVSSDEPKDGNSMWDLTTGVKEFQPLYDNKDNVIAYYISFKPSGYVIVNNNTQNPVALEFSDEDSGQKELLYKGLNGEKIIYGSNFNDEKLFNITNEEKEIYRKAGSEFYNSISDINESEIIAHQDLKSKLNPTIMKNEVGSGEIDIISLGGSFNIIDRSDLPSGSYTSKNIPSYSSVTWGRTGEFSGVNGAKNHCGATAAFNVVNYYRTRYGRSNLFYSNSRISTFTKLHEKIGNGPVTFIGLNSGLKTYVNSRTGSSYSGNGNGGYANIKSQIFSGNMCVVLLSAGIVDWHYVNAIGYRDYYSGSSFINVIDGWNNTTSKFIYSTNLVGSYKTHIN